MTDIELETLTDIRERLDDLLGDSNFAFIEDQSAREFMGRLIAQIDALAALVGKMGQKTSGPPKASGEPARDPRITPKPGDRISRTVRDIKTTRTVVEVITGPGGLVVEVSFVQAGPTSSRPKRHSLTNWIDWARKATIEHWGE